LTHHFNSVFQIRPEIGYYRNWKYTGVRQRPQEWPGLYGFDLIWRF